MTKKLFEDILAEEVLTRYLETMRHSIEFHQNPYLDMGYFKKHFAAVAHQNNIFHGQERTRYNMFFGLVRTRISAAIKRLADNETKNKEGRLASQPDLFTPTVSTPPAAPAPTPHRSALPGTDSPAFQQFKRWSRDHKAAHAAK